MNQAAKIQHGYLFFAAAMVVLFGVYVWPGVGADLMKFTAVLFAHGNTQGSAESPGRCVETSQASRLHGMVEGGGSPDCFFPAKPPAAPLTEHTVVQMGTPLKMEAEPELARVKLCWGPGLYLG